MRDDELPAPIKKNLYYAVQNIDGSIECYGVIRPRSRFVINPGEVDCLVNDFAKVLTVHFEGYTGVYYYD